MEEKKPNIIKDKSFAFAIKVINLYKGLVDKKEFVISKQLLRSGTAIGALVREAEHAESSADFVHKLAISQKEANESDYWIDLLYETEYIDKKQFDVLKKDIQEIMKILASIILTTKQKLRSKR